MCGIFFKDLTDDKDDFEDIWARIVKLAPHQSQWEIDIPTHWIKLERDIQRLAAEWRPVIKYKDLLDIASPELGNLVLFLKYMKASGFIITLNQNTYKPDDDIVIDPQWLIDAFRHVIDFDDYHKSSYGPIRRITLGELTEQDASDLWEDSRFQQKTKILLKFMEYLGLIAMPRNGGFYYIPSLLDCNTRDEELEKWLNKDERDVSKSVILDFRKNNKQVPFPHFDKMMAEFISRQTKESLRFVARYVCIVTEDDLSIGYAINHGSSLMKITLFAQSNEVNKHMSNGNFGKNLLRTLLGISKDISKRFGQLIAQSPIIGISCVPFCHPKQKQITYVPVEELPQNKDVQRSCCNEAGCLRVQRRDLDVWGLGKYF